MTYLVQDIVLKNAESWARLVRESVTAAAIKSSKESFQHFRKAALEKEEREKALKKKEREVPETNRYSLRKVKSKCPLIMEGKTATIRNTVGQINI